MGTWQYDDSDIERLGLIMTLHDLGFDNREVETYMRLYMEKEKTGDQRMDMLNMKRNDALNEIHFREAQLMRLDYLRHSIKNTKGEN